MDLSLQSLKELPLQTFEYKEHSKRNHPNHIPRSQRSLESSSKASRNLNKSKISEAQRIQASKAPKNFHHKPSKTKTTRRTRRTWRTKDFQQAHSQRFIVILFQRSSIYSLAKLKYIGCSSQNHITTNPINKYFKEIESEDHSFVILENCTTQSSIQTRICETISLVWLISNREI